MIKSSIFALYLLDLHSLSCAQTRGFILIFKKQKCEIIGYLIRISQVKQVIIGFLCEWKKKNPYCSYLILSN